MWRPPPPARFKQRSARTASQRLEPHGSGRAVGQVFAARVGAQPGTRPAYCRHGAGRHRNGRGHARRFASGEGRYVADLDALRRGAGGFDTEGLRSAARDDHGLAPIGNSSANRKSSPREAPVGIEPRGSDNGIGDIGRGWECLQAHWWHRLSTILIDSVLESTLSANFRLFPSIRRTLRPSLER